MGLEEIKHDICDCENNITELLIKIKTEKDRLKKLKWEQRRIKKNEYLRNYYQNNKEKLKQDNKVNYYCKKAEEINL